MRFISIIFSLFLITACSSQTEDGNSSNTAAVPSSGNNTITNTACEAISVKAVAEIMEWPVASSAQEEQVNRKGGRTTMCAFTNNEKEGWVSVYIKHENEKSIEYKNLEKVYAKFLSEGEDKITYEKIPAVIGSESLYGSADAMYGMKSHILRSRFENSLAVNVEAMSDGSDPNGIKAQLIAIAKALR